MGEAAAAVVQARPASHGRIAHPCGAIARASIVLRARHHVHCWASRLPPRFGADVPLARIQACVIIRIGFGPGMTRSLQLLSASPLGAGGFSLCAGPVYNAPVRVFVSFSWTRASQLSPGFAAGAFCTGRLANSELTRFHRLDPWNQVVPENRALQIAAEQLKRSGGC
jgi:hypothetical protein